MNQAELSVSLGQSLPPLLTSKDAIRTFLEE